MSDKVITTTFMGAKISASCWSDGKIAYVNAKNIAKIIRKILKEKYPNIKFRVITDTGAWVNSISIYFPKDLYAYSFGAEVKEKCHLDRFIAGRFNGMTDSYDYENKIPLMSDDKMYILEATVQFITVSEGW